VRLIFEKCCTVGSFWTVFVSASPCRWEQYQCSQSSVQPHPWGERASCLVPRWLGEYHWLCRGASSTSLNVTVSQEFFKTLIHLVLFTRNKIKMGHNRYTLKFYSLQFNWGSILRLGSFVTDTGESVRGNTSSHVEFPFNRTILVL
jgi:hypothetical protein